MDVRQMGTRPALTLRLTAGILGLACACAWACAPALWWEGLKEGLPFLAPSKLLVPWVPWEGLVLRRDLAPKEGVQPTGSGAPRLCRPLLEPGLPILPPPLALRTRLVAPLPGDGVPVVYPPQYPGPRLLLLACGVPTRCAPA